MRPKVVEDDGWSDEEADSKANQGGAQPRDRQKVAGGRTEADGTHRRGQDAEEEEAEEEEPTDDLHPLPQIAAAPLVCVNSSQTIVFYIACSSRLSLFHFVTQSHCFSRSLFSLLVFVASFTCDCARPCSSVQTHSPAQRV